MPPGAEEDGGSATSDDQQAAQIGAVRGPKGGMPPPTTAAWLRARFRREVKLRFKGDSSRSVGGKVGGGSRGGGPAAGSLTALRVSFSLPLGAYATSLLQHVTGEGLDGREKAWHTARARDGGYVYERDMERDGEEEGREDDRGLQGRGDA